MHLTVPKSKSPMPLLTYKLSHQVTICVHGAGDVVILNEWEEELHKLHCVRWCNNFQHLQDRVCMGLLKENGPNGTY